LMHSGCPGSAEGYFEVWARGACNPCAELYGLSFGQSQTARTQRPFGFNDHIPLKTRLFITKSWRVPKRINARSLTPLLKHLLSTRHTHASFK
jgi:hypothetical protein